MSDMPIQQYHVRFRGKVSGPYEESRIRQMLKRHQITRMHEISSDGHQWTRMRDMPDLLNDPYEDKATNESRDTQRSAQSDHAELENPPATQHAADNAQASARVDEQSTTSLSNTEKEVDWSYSLDLEPEEKVDWYYSLDDEPVGPITSQNLGTLLRSKKLDPQTLVWRQGMDQWATLDEAGFGVSQVSPPTAASPLAQSGPSMLDTSTRTVASASDPYEEIPWLRRATVQWYFVVLGFFCVPFVILIPFFTVLTGDVFENNYDKTGRIKRWGAFNKGLVLVLSAIYFFAITAYFLNK